MGASTFKLNLGCGDRHWPGFINIDIQRPGMKLKPDIISSVTQLPFEENTVDEIHAIHLLEHLPRWMASEILEGWRFVLKPGGLLVLELPCLDKIVHQLHTVSHLPFSQRLYELPDGRKVDIYDACLDGLYGDRREKDREMMHHWCYSRGEIQNLLSLEHQEFSQVFIVEPKYHRPFRDMRVEARK